MIKHLVLGGLLAALAAVSASAQTSEFLSLRAPLNSSAEVPPVDAAASGSALVLIQTTRDADQAVTRAVVGFYAAFKTTDEAMLTAMHIHEGSAAENGPVVIDSQFGAAVDLPAGSSQIFREVVLTSEDDLATLQQIVNSPGGFYLNVHSADHPDGLARGQLESLDIADDSGSGGPSTSELSSKLDIVQETVARIARRLGVVPAGAGDAQ
jgi:hypothetical protein